MSRRTNGHEIGENVAKRMQTAANIHVSSKNVAE